MKNTLKFKLNNFKIRGWLIINKNNRFHTLKYSKINLQLKFHRKNNQNDQLVGRDLGWVQLAEVNNTQTPVKVRLLELTKVIIWIRVFKADN